jgi:hypothetical protein
LKKEDVQRAVLENVQIVFTDDTKEYNAFAQILSGDRSFYDQRLLFGVVQREAIQEALALVRGWSDGKTDRSFDDQYTPEAAAQAITERAIPLVSKFLKLGFSYVYSNKTLSGLVEAEEEWKNLPNNVPSWEVYFDDDPEIRESIESCIVQHCRALEHLLLHLINKGKADGKPSTWQTVQSGCAYGVYMNLLEWWTIGNKTAENVLMTEEMEKSFVEQATTEEEGGHNPEDSDPRGPEV